MYKEKFRRKAGLSLLDPNLQLVGEDPAAALGQNPPLLPTTDSGRPRGGDGGPDDDGQEYADCILLFPKCFTI